MKILVYGINFKPELSGVGKYTGEMADWMNERRHEVHVVTAPPYYPDWVIASSYGNSYSVESPSEMMSVYRCPLYVPSRPTTLTRLLHLVSFAISSFFVMLRLIRLHPDVVFVVQPTLFCAPIALIYARITGALAVLHIQDYEIDAMFGLGLMRQRWYVRFVEGVERWIMSRFDIVSSISNSMVRIAKEKGVKDGGLFFFPNWVDTDFITPWVDRSIFRKKLGISENTKVVLYSGNIGKKQGLELVLDAANFFREQNVLFLFVGEGAARQELQALAEDLQLANVRFEPLQPYADLPLMLAAADVHLIVQRAGVADVVLPSKLTGILSAGGCALITADPNTELGLLVDQFPRIAVRVAPESTEAFIEALKGMLVPDAPHFNQVARAYAVKYLSKDEILGRFEELIMARCKK